MKKTLLTLASFITLATNTQAQVSFNPQVTYGTDAYPISVHSADFNGDTFLDLVTANSSSNGSTVSVLLGSGTGTFAPQTTYAVGSYPSSVYSADFNGDNKMDLVTANASNNTVSVLLGSGTGTFAPQTTYAVGSNPLSVYSADFNGDGKKDLVTANSNGVGTVSVLLGSASGTFAPQTTYTVGFNPRSVYSADFNGDTFLDLVTANYAGNTVSVLLGSGTGTFAPQVTYAVGTNPYSVYSADFNGDGDMDIVTANYNSSNVSVLLGSASGTFATQATYAVGTGPLSVYSADFNNDGKKDLVTANNSGNYVSVLLGSGTGTFAPQTTYAVGSYPSSVYSADFNGDNKMDLVTANASNNNVSVLLNTAIPTNTTGTASALNFWGNNYVNLGTSIPTTLSASNKITVEAWVNPALSTGNGIIVGNYNTVGTDMQFLLRKDGSDYTFWVNNGSGFANVTSVATVTTAVWQHVAGTWDGSNIKIYVNGALSATTSFTGTALKSYTDPVWIGSNLGSQNFIGSMDELRIWNRTLTQTEIASNMHCPLTIPQTSLVAYYQLNQGMASAPNPTETTAIDASGNGNTGTLSPNFALTGAFSNWVAPGGINVLNVNSGAICTGQSYTITPSGASTYTFSSGSAVVSPTINNTYTVTSTDAYGCVNTAVASVTVNPLPTISATTSNTLLCTGETATLTASGASTYNWNTSETTTVIAVSPTTTTVYTVTGTDANGCVNTTTITQDVSLCTGINAVAEALEATIQVYPNPTNGIITIELATINDNTKVELLNTLGQVLHWETATAKNLTLNIQNLNSGIYYLKANSNGNAKTIKIIKQ